MLREVLLVDRADVEAVVERYLELHAACALESVLALFRADAVLEDPVGAPAIQGEAAIRAFYARTHQANGSLRIEHVGPVIVCGREATAHVRAAAEKANFDPEVDVIYSFRCDSNGRIELLRAFFETGDPAG